jgi:transcriptional regulator with XRE-family HTH domain
LEDETLGSKIRRLRSELGFTVHHLAVALVVTPDTIQKLEDDGFKEIPRRWLTKIAALTGVETKHVVEVTNIKYYDPPRQMYILED